MQFDKDKIYKALQSTPYSTLTELAAALDITKNQLSVMLSDKYDPIKSGAQKLCKLLNKDLYDLTIKQNSNSCQTNLQFIDKAPTAVELFAGAGGLALGLEKSGFHTQCFVEIDKTCCKTLKYNRPEWNVIESDICQIDFTPFKNKIDLVTGGFPCQAFSYAGKKLGFEDTRGTLFYEFARCVRETNPKMFLAENVRGLLSHDNGHTFQTILNVFQELGYHVKYKVLNAAYYGVGQKRERVFIVGVRNDFKTTFEFPKPNKKMTTLAEALKDCPKSPGALYSEKKKAVLDLVPPGGCWINLPENVAKTYMGKSYYAGGGKRGMARRISWDEPCLTLTCSPSQKQTERCHPEETRPFTIREYARIQSFPDEWEFIGSIGSQYKQIGNAVPVKLAEAVGLALKYTLQQLKKIEKPISNRTEKNESAISAEHKITFSKPVTDTRFSQENLNQVSFSDFDIEICQ